jgi:hypothetical protein
MATTLNARVTVRQGQPFNEAEIALLNTARQENGYWLIQTHEGRITGMRRVSSLVEVRREGGAAEMPAG